MAASLTTSNSKMYEDGYILSKSATSEQSMVQVRAGIMCNAHMIIEI